MPKHEINYLFSVTILSVFAVYAQNYQQIISEMAKLHFKQAKQQGLKADVYVVMHNHPDTGKMVEDSFWMR